MEGVAAPGPAGDAVPGRAATGVGRRRSRSSRGGRGGRGRRIRTCPDRRRSPPAVAGRCTPSSSATARPSRICVSESDGRRRRVLARRVGAGPPRGRAALAVLPLAGARGVRGRLDRARSRRTCTAWPPTAVASCSRSTTGPAVRRRRTRPKPRASLKPRPTRESGCASASGMRPVRCGQPSRWSWSGRRGSTTSASPQATSCSSSRRRRRLADEGGAASAVRMGARGRRAGSAWSRAAATGRGVRWFRLDPCLVTHVLGAWDEEGRNGDVEVVLYVCRYDAPEEGQPVDLSASVVGPAGIGLSTIGGSLGSAGTLAGRRRPARTAPGRRAAPSSTRGSTPCARVKPFGTATRSSSPGDLGPTRSCPPGC